MAAMLAVGLLAGSGAAARAGVLWYNGDFDGRNGLSNEINTSISDAIVYDDFIVTDPGGWDINYVWSNNLMNFRTSSAAWEIRSGISDGDGGTLIAGGTTNSAVQLPTGRSGFGFDESTILITGLSVHLAPGTYWLAVTPIDSGGGRSFISTTSGQNSIGVPPGNDDNSFFNSSFFVANYSPAANWVGNFPADFSMGVGAVPEPSTVALVACGLGMLALPRLRRRGPAA
jgi:hypothetical protein